MPGESKHLGLVDRHDGALDFVGEAAAPSFWANPKLRQWNLWSWVDSRDVAQACRLSVEADVPSAEAFTIAAADTLMRRSSRTLMTEAFPNVPITGQLGEFDTLLSVDKARRILGYQPQHSWRERFRDIT